MSVNKNCYYALKMESTETASVPAIDGLGLWEQDFTLSMEFYLLQESEELCLFRQDGVIEVGYNSAYFYITAGDTRYTVTSSCMRYYRKLWNSLAVVFHKDTGELCAYINGAMGFQKTIGIPECGNTAAYTAGSLLYGYVRKVKCLGRALTDTEVLNDPACDPEAPEQYEFYMDFTSRFAEERGKHGLSLKLGGFSGIVTLVQTIDFGSAGYVLPERNDYVSVGQFSSGEFTVLGKVYLKDSRSRHVLLARQEAASSYGFLMGLDYTSGSPRMFVQMGDTLVTAEKELELYRWLDLAAVYREGKLYLYADGVSICEKDVSGIEADSSLTALTIGNTGKSDDYTAFCGYIDSVCVFSRGKTGEQIAGYLKTLPTPYSEGIAAYYSFADLVLREYMKNTGLELMKQARQVIAEVTQEEEDDGEEISFDQGEEKSITEFDFWQANLIDQVFIQMIIAATGEKPSGGVKEDGSITSAAARLILRNAAKLPAACAIIVGYQNLTEEMVLAFLGEAFAGGLFGFLWGLSFSGASAGAASAAAAAGALAAGAAAGVPGGGGYPSLLNSILSACVNALKNLITDPNVDNDGGGDDSGGDDSGGDDSGDDDGDDDGGDGGGGDGGGGDGGDDDGDDDDDSDDDDNDDDDDDDDDDGVVIQVTSIRFCHTPENLSESAAFLYHDYTASAQDSPEWELGKPEKSPSSALYFRSQAGAVKIRVKVKVTITGDTAYAGNIWASSSAAGGTGADTLMGDLPKVWLEASESGEQELEFCLENNPFTGKEPGRYEEQWFWEADSSEEGLTTVLGVTLHETWLLDALPTDAWNITSEEQVRNISVNTLKLLADIRDYDPSEAAGGRLVLSSRESWLKQMVYFIHDSGRFAYNQDVVHRYSDYESSTMLLYFDKLRLEEDYDTHSRSGEKQTLSSLDTSMMMKAWAELLGYEVGIAWIWSNDNNEEYDVYDSETSTWTMMPSCIVFNTVIPMGEQKTEFIVVPKEYFAVNIGADGGTAIYDAAIAGNLWENTESTDKQEERIYFTGFPFTSPEYQEDLFCSKSDKNYYREASTSPGNSFYLVDTFSQWKLSAVEMTEKLPVLGLFRWDRDGVAYASRREQYINNILGELGIDLRQAHRDVVAHIVSYKYMQNVLQTLVNNAASFSVEEYANLADLISVLFLGYDNNELATKLHWCYIDMRSEDAMDKKRAVVVLNQVSQELYTSIYNLKAGDFRWNSSVNAAFDLEDGWGLILPDGDRIGTVPDGQTKDGLYVTENDKNRIEIMKTIHELIKEKSGQILYPLKPCVKYIIQNDGSRLYFVASSSNTEAFEAYKRGKVTPVNVYDCMGNELYHVSQAWT